MTNKTLLIIPTYTEARMLLEKPNITASQQSFYKLDDLSANLLISGPGLPASMMQIAQHLQSDNNYHLLMMAGLAGSYSSKIKPAELVCVEAEKTADIGYVHQNKFHALTSEKEWEPFYKKGVLINTFQTLCHETGLKNVSSNTVNVANFNIQGKPDADIENMEGAGFFMLAQEKAIPFLEIRAISNYVTERDKDKWKTEMALTNLHAFLMDYLTTKTV
ncbi:MAG: hypothetical protein PF590_01700 [Candidatus Delongbacteria bacterium]|nr:hypothetical protein [Candidatus Delongbacteria bacterium]